MEKHKRNRKIEMLLWSVALPGFGQLLNRKYVKGVLLVILEVLINVLGKVNKVIVLSFHGKIEEAIEVANYDWLMFYPCVYFFAIWDAYKDAGGGKGAYSFIPLVCTAYVVTIGLTYSPVFKVFGQLIGPMWLMILSVPVGLLIGSFVRRLVLKVASQV